MRNNTRAAVQRNHSLAVLALSIIIPLAAVGTLGWFTYTTARDLLDALTLLLENS